MKKTTRAPMTLVALLVLVTATPGLQSCEHTSPEALMILNIMALMPGQRCQIRNNQPAEAIRLNGVLDLMTTNQYWLFPSFRNMLNPLSSMTGENLESPEVEGHYMVVQRAKTYVDIGEFASGLSGNNAKLRDKYMVSGVESFVAASAAPLGTGAVAIQAIPPELGNLLDTKMKDLTKTVASPQVWITLYVSLFGQTQTGEVVQSNEFSFPVMLCWGCLVSPSCPDAVSDIPCFIGQDDSIVGTLCPYVANHPEGCPCPQ